MEMLGAPHFEQFGRWAEARLKQMKEERGQESMSGPAVLGLDALPLFLLELVFWCGFSINQKLRQKSAPSSSSPQGPRGGGMEAGPRFLQQENEFYWESLKDLLCSCY